MIKFFTRFLFTFLFVSQGLAQDFVNYERDSRWFIGLNAGATWTSQTEVPYRIRGGYGLTFGKSYGMEPNKVFSWDIRARFLHAQVQGQASQRYSLDSNSTIGLNHYGVTTIQNYQDSLGYFIPNYKTNLLRGSVELVLNTNKWRQNKGWNLYVFGGLGITGYHTSTDLVSNDLGSALIYDYDELGSANMNSLLNFQDGDFETDLVGNDAEYFVDWMPSFGFGLTKQIHPAVAFGIEHKMTWTRSNLFDGMPNNFEGNTADLNDRYHYTGLTLKFHLFRGKSTIYEDDDEVVVDDFDTKEDPIITDPVTRKKPIVDIYDPNSSPYTTTESTFRIRANVHYVDGKSNITFKQDGNINTNFSYNASTDKFESVVVLHPGQNLFEITGKNDAGSDYESVIIVYQEEEEPKNPPIVTITNPPTSPYTTSSDVFGLVSTVLNVDSKSQIKVYLNGVHLNSFSYSLSSKVLNASLLLKKGTNTVTVTATNDVGSDSKTVQLIYEEPTRLQPPIVDFVFPGSNPHYTSKSNIAIQANALHVPTKAGLTIKVNGNLMSSYSFNVVTKAIYFTTNLIEGANIVEITGVNDAGSDYASTTIIYNQPQQAIPPVVSFIDPAANPITVYTPSYNVTAKVEHVNSKSDITLKINGTVSGAFSYSTSSDLMNFTTSLVEGSNVVEIKGVNEHGLDIATTTIIYKRTIPQAPPIVTITNPAVDNMVFGTPSITLTSTVLNVTDAGNIDVTINGIPTLDFTYNTYTKVLNLPLYLNEGLNSVTITGNNVAGSDSKTRFIIYEKPANPAPPTVVFINPPTSPHLSEASTYTVTANATNIDAKSQIVFKQNGVLISDGAYSFIGGNQIVYNATLISGSNIFEVSVENEDGSDEDLAVINYVKNDAPCIIPTVGYISPVPYSTVDDPAVTIDAQINNHSPGTIVELKLNGVSKGYMSYNAGTSIASKDITLLEGSNAVTVIVTNNCGTNQATFTLNYEAPDAPCYAPTLSLIGSAAYSTEATSADVHLTGTHIDATENITVQLNGSSKPFSFDAGTGAIDITGLPLTIGSNSIVVSVTTNCGSAVKVITITRTECKKPTISAINPADGTTVEGESIEFSATISNVVEGDITLLVNGISQGFTFNAETKVLTKAVALTTGLNTIQLSVENDCGSVSKTVSIEREIPCETIVTNLFTPATTTYVSTEEMIDISLNATGLNDAEQIVVKQNGVVKDFSFDEVTGDILIEDINLVDGTNSVNIVLKNDCSEAKVNYTITYEGCEPPVIVINGVWPGMAVKEEVYNLGVVITNVAGVEDIELKLNGESVEFDYNPVTHLLTATLILTEGANTIEVIANGCETASATTTINYEIPCVVISHSLLSPVKSTVTSVEPLYAISLGTTGIENKDEIKVQFNGKTYPFTFNMDTKTISISGLMLKDGKNSVIVTLTNDCSSDVINYTITYDGCKEPVITTGILPSKVDVATFSFGANITNVSAEQILFFLNDIPTPFVFNSKTNAINATLELEEGENKIHIVANGCEKVEKTLTINYEIPCTPITFALGTPSKTSVSSADANYSIELIAQHVNKDGITVTNNGKSIPFTYADNVLKISAIELKDGLNTVIVTLTNPCSSETITFKIDHDNCNSPTIDMSMNELSTGLTIYPFAAIITEVASDKNVTLMVNGVEQAFVYDPITDNLNSSLVLKEGLNEIEIVAVGCETVSSKINVNYTIPCIPVTYSLVSPTSLISTVDEETINIRLNTTNVSPETVIGTVNGESFTTTIGGGIINMSSIPLAEGSNTIVIQFGNDCSSETLTYIVEHEICESPNIVINGYTDGMVLTEGEFVFFANVYNVTDAGEITLKLNGVSIPFEFDAVANLLQAPVILTDGTNSIEIIVDGCEFKTGGVDVILDTPCAPPTYTLIAPTESDIEIAGDTYTISLGVSNVTEDQIEVKINGGSVDFTYSAGTIFIVVPYISVPTNAVEIILTNECGTVEVDFLVTFIVEEEDCTPTVAAEFSPDKLSVTASSNKDLMNVVLNLHDGTTQLITDVDGMSGTFTATGDKAGSCIVGVWIRSGCNLGAAGEPFGDYIANPLWDGICETKSACAEIEYTPVSPTRLSVVTSVSPYNIVLSSENIENVNGIRAIVNGKIQKVSFDGRLITLSGINLIKGSNVIQFLLTNDCSTESITYTITYNPPGQQSGQIGGSSGSLGGDDQKDSGNDGKSMKVQSSPSITPISPATSKITVKSKTLSLKASVKNVSSKSNITLYVNGFKVTNFTYSSQTEQLSAVIALKNGVNMIKITAENGLKDDFTYYVTYQADDQNKGQLDNGNSGGQNQQLQVALSPKLSRVTPSTSTASTTSSSYLFKVKTTNVASKSDLTLNVNGVNITNFTFSSSSKIMSAVLKLKEGKNTVKVIAKNKDKQMSLTYSITYNKPAQQGQINPQGGNNSGQIGAKETVKKPLIKRVSPTGSSITVKNETYVIKATISNVSSKSDITFLVNGAKSTAFTFNAKTGQFVATIKLNGGTNSIRISAKNGNLSATASYTITYQASKEIKSGGFKQSGGNSGGGLKQNNDENSNSSGAGGLKSSGSRR